MKLSRNFREEEFQCKGSSCCGGSAPMDSGFINRLQGLRSEVDQSIEVSSGFRCKKHNSETEGAAPKSYHTKGKASDIKTQGLSVDEFADIAEKYFNCVIRYSNRIHVDSRENPFYADKRG